MAKPVAMAALLIALLVAATAQAQGPALPPQMAGITGWDGSGSDANQTAAAGAGMTRYYLNWQRVQPRQDRPIDWSSSDSVIEQVARDHLRLDLVVSAPPKWTRSSSRAPISQMPIWGKRGIRSWQRFVGAAAARYGSNGSFWRHHPRLYQPTIVWEIWNEPNKATSRVSDRLARQFATLINVTGPVIHHFSPGSTVITGGLFPLASPGFLRSFYEHANKSAFDGVGLHPYWPDPYGSYKLITEVRKVMNTAGDAKTGIWINEIGWASQTTKHRLDSVAKQARNLRILFQMLAIHRVGLGLKSVIWFGLRDDPNYPGGCEFCRSSGLLFASGHPKPSWLAFKSFISTPAQAIRGRVTDAHGRALPRRHLYLDLNSDGHFESGEPQAETNRSGSYSFTSLRPGTFELTLTHRPGERCRLSCRLPVNTAKTAPVRFAVRR